MNQDYKNINNTVDSNNELPPEGIREKSTVEIRKNINPIEEIDEIIVNEYDNIPSENPLEMQAIDNKNDDNKEFHKQSIAPVIIRSDINPADDVPEEAKYIISSNEEHPENITKNDRFKNSEPIIQVKNLTVRYDDRTIVDNISFDIKRGEIFMIVGGSGCGKSTVLRQIIGLEKPAEGDILIDGHSIVNAQGKEKTAILNKFGVLFQSSGLFASMTLAENIALKLETSTDLNTSQILELIEIKLSAVGLGGYQNFLPSEISGGMKKRAALARAMAIDPPILCFDEPSSGLDPVTAASMDSLIMDLNSALGTTMVVVSHDLDGVLNTAHRVIMLDKGAKGIVAEGHPKKLKEMKENPKVYNFFNRISE